VPESFCRALLSAALDGLAAAGHEADVVDLYAEDFDPVMSADERRLYNEPESPMPAEIAGHVERLKRAEGLLFVYPTWWYGQPAMLKGYLDRVFRPGTAFTMPTAEQGLKPALGNVRFVGIATTLGSPWWLWTLVIGAPGAKIILRGIRGCCSPRTRTLWLALHRMDTANADARGAFLARVRRRLAAVR
jgi:putative NADPH-quinone reductase